VKYKPYPAYRDSGVAWLGNVPEHWVGCRLKHALAEMDSGGTPDTSNLDYWSDSDDGIPWVAIGDMSGVDVVSETSKSVSSLGIQDKGLHVFPKGTLLFSMYASLGHVAELAMHATTNQAILGLVPDSLTHQAFLKRWLQFLQPYLVESASSNTQANLNAEKVRNLPFVKVGKSEQAAIATFLDRETAKLDTLIAKQEKLIELLQEKRQALISHAVIKGLNPDAPMKDSGVAWLGKVPAHWEVVRLGILFREVSESGNDELPVLRVSIHDGVSDREFDEEELDRKVTRSEDRSKYKRVEPGDLVYNMMRAWQGGFGAVTVPGMVSPAYVVARPRGPLHTEFVEHLLRTPQAVEKLRCHSYGVADFRLRLYWDEFKSIGVAMPPLNEQEEIMESISRESCKIDALIEKSRRSIDLMREHRTALISAAVTGKIDLRAQHQSAA